MVGVVPFTGNTVEVFIFFSLQFEIDRFQPHFPPTNHPSSLSFALCAHFHQRAAATKSWTTIRPWRHSGDQATPILWGNRLESGRKPHRSTTFDPCFPEFRYANERNRLGFWRVWSICSLCGWHGSLLSETHHQTSVIRMDSLWFETRTRRWAHSRNDSFSRRLETSECKLE